MYAHFSSSLGFPMLTKPDACTARPKLSEVMQDTKFLFQQSREKLVLTYVTRFSGTHLMTLIRGAGAWRMIYQGTLRIGTRSRSYRIAQTVRYVSSSGNKLRSNGRCHGTTRGEIGSGCTVLGRIGHHS